MSEGELDGTPGARLAEARTEAGLAVRDVSDALNLPIHVVEAIESGERDKMPDRVFAQGYVRAYAKLLNLEPEPLVAAFTAGYGESVEVKSERTPVATPTLPPNVMLGAAGALLLIVLLWAFWPSSEETMPAGTETAAEEAPVETPATVDSEPARDASTPISTPPLSEPSVAEPIRTTETTQLNSLAGETAAAPASLAVVQADDRQRLVMSFIEDCWVEIRSADGALLLADLGKAGGELSFEAEGPIQLLLGYAPGARVTFNGENVPLVPHTRNNVANLVLGQ